MLSHPNFQTNQKLVAATQTVAKFQNFNLEVESTTLQNAIIIPISILLVILTSPNQSPANLAILILNVMKHLDHLNNTKNKKELPLEPLP
jgi:hypothetical protein